MVWGSRWWLPGQLAGAVGRPDQNHHAYANLVSSPATLSGTSFTNLYKKVLALNTPAALHHCHQECCQSSFLLQSYHCTDDNDDDEAADDDNLFICLLTNRNTNVNT